MAAGPGECTPDFQTAAAPAVFTAPTPGVPGRRFPRRSRPFLLVGQRGEALVHHVQLLAVQMEAQIFAALGERVAAAVFAQHQLLSGTPTDFGSMIS